MIIVLNALTHYRFKDDCDYLFDHRRTGRDLFGGGGGWSLLPEYVIPLLARKSNGFAHYALKLERACSWNHSWNHIAKSWVGSVSALNNVNTGCPALIFPIESIMYLIVNRLNFLCLFREHLARQRERNITPSQFGDEEKSTSIKAVAVFMEWSSPTSQRMLVQGWHPSTSLCHRISIQSE